MTLSTRLGRHGHAIRDEPEFAAPGIDPDADTDSDPEGSTAAKRLPNNTLHQTGATEPIGTGGVRVGW